MSVEWGDNLTSRAMASLGSGCSLLSLRPYLSGHFEGTSVNEEWMPFINCQRPLKSLQKGTSILWPHPVQLLPGMRPLKESIVK